MRWENKEEIDATKLHVFFERLKKRFLVGALHYSEKRDKYTFEYADSYQNMPKAMALSPELSLLKKKHVSKKGKLFDFFVDRIPLKENPAYKDYCKAVGISEKEDNPIVLLATLGRKTFISHFVFEIIPKKTFKYEQILKERKELNISQDDFSKIFDIPIATFQKVEQGKSENKNILKLLQIYFEFPEVALWQIEKSSSKVSEKAYLRVKKHFLKKIKLIKLSR